MAGQYCEAPDVLPTLNPRPAVKAFVAEYIKRAGYAPDPYPTLYYDGMNMLITVMLNYGADREKIREGMAATSFEGVLGTYKADSEGNLWHHAAVMKFLSGGEVDVPRTFDPKF